MVLIAALAGGGHAETLLIRSDLAGTWIDATDGTPLNIAGDDVADIVSTVGNAVFSTGTWHVGNNGGVGFGTSNLMPPVNQPIPTQQLYQGQQAVAPFADDIGDDTGNTFWKVVHRHGSRADVLVIEWFDKRFEGQQDTSRFEIQIFSDPGPNRIYAQFLYQDIEQPWPNGGAIATIGYQDGGAGFNDVQWSYHVAGAVSNGMVLSLVPEPAAMGLAIVLLSTVRRRIP
jgi:hypothetical protein